MIDLVALQQNTGRIRNPFGFDFVHTWNEKPIVLKGDGEWKTVIGPLRDLLATHLYMKVRYQYHDEQVMKLRDSGKDRDARKYHVPAPVEDKIWRMITGEAMPSKKVTATDIAQEKADLSALEAQIDHLDSTAGNGGPVSVSAIIDRANSEVLDNGGGALNAGSSTHSSGSADIMGNDVVAAPIDRTPVDAENLTETASSDSVEMVEPVAPTNEDTTTTPAAAEAPEFPGLSELDNG